MVRAAQVKASGRARSTELAVVSSCSRPSANELSDRLAPISTGPRPERQHRPVHEDDLQRRAAPLHAENPVHRIVDRQHQHHRGHHEAGDADRGQPPGVAGEGVDLLGDGVDARGVGQHVVHDELLQRLDRMVEHRERGRGSEHHGEQRYQRKQRGEGEAARGLHGALFAEALHHGDTEFPRTAQRVPEHQSFYHTVMVEFLVLYRLR